MIISLFKNLGKKIGIDGAIAFTILTRLIQAGGGIISIVFIARFLTPAEQGYYYTFASILAIQIFFELGLSGVITQYTAHEFAHLSWGENFQIIGDGYYSSRLSSLLRFCVKWFAIIAIVLFFVLLAAGFYFFGKFNSNTGIMWQFPWIILCLTTSLNLFIDPLLAYFDGLGHVKDMAKVRLWQKSINTVLLFVFFALGFKLYSAALASLAAILFNYFQIIFSGRVNFLKAIWKAKNQWVINYYHEIFPFQWRIAVSWISGYFIFQLFNPVLFATEGPVVAGQMGMTIAALTGIGSISMSWINTKIPMLSTFIAKEDYTELDKHFKKIFINSTAISIFCVLILVAGVQLARHFHLTIGNRFLMLIPFLCMGIASVINHMVYAFATYLRCHKKEPMLVQSIVCGVLVSLSTFILGHKFGVNGITVGYFTLTLLVGLTWTVFTFNLKRNEWHNE